MAPWFSTDYSESQPAMPLSLGGVCTIGIPYAPKQGCAIGVDAGGTLIKGLVLADGRVAHTQVAESSGAQSLEALITAISDVVRSCRAHAPKKVFSLGLGLAGWIPPDALDDLRSRMKPVCHEASELFVQKDAALEAYGVRVIDGPASAMVLNLGVNRVTGGLIDQSGEVRFDLAMELGNMIVAVGSGPRPVEYAPPGALVQFVSRAGWLCLAGRRGVAAGTWEQLAERTLRGDSAAVETMEAVARWIVAWATLMVDMMPAARIYLSGGTAAGPLGERLAAAAGRLACETPGPLRIVRLPWDPLFGGAFGAAHAANHASQVSEMARKLRGETGGEFGGAIRAASFAMLTDVVPHIVLGPEPHAPLGRQACLEMLGRIMDADDPKLTNTVLPLVARWVCPQMGEVLADQIESAARMGQQQHLRRLAAYRDMFRAMGVV